MARFHYYKREDGIMVTGLDDCMGDWGTIYGSWDEFNKLSDEEKDELGEKALAKGYVYMKTKKMLKEIAAYCRNNIEDFELRVQVALGFMERCRCPLDQADYSLYDEMYECAREWAEDNGYSVDEWDEESGIDVEEIIWEC